MKIVFSLDFFSRRIYKLLINIENKMEKVIIIKLTKSFEDYVHNIEGIEFWNAREL